MKITLAEFRGFCPGVRRAVQKALEALEQYGTVWSLGPLIHNRQVVDDLISRGLKVVENVAEVPVGAVLLIRSHGVSPAVSENAKRRRLTLIDATCGLVRRAQQLVAQLADEGYQVLVVGDPHHPEVQGLTGYGRDVLVISKPEDIDRLSHSVKVGVVAQTTKSPRYVANTVHKLILCGFDEIKFVNTLCDQSIARQESATELARNVDVMFVLGGLESANTRHLAELCREAAVKTYHLESVSQLEPHMYDRARSIGITAGASTPDRLIDEFVAGLKDGAKTCGP